MKKINQICFFLKQSSIYIFLLLTTGCSHYSSQWDCPKISGVKCTSIIHAEEIARNQILLEKEASNLKELSLKEYYEGYEKIPRQRIIVR